MEHSTPDWPKRPVRILWCFPLRLERNISLRSVNSEWHILEGNNSWWCQMNCSWTLHRWTIRLDNRDQRMTKVINRWFYSCIWRPSHPGIEGVRRRTRWCDRIPWPSIGHWLEDLGYLQEWFKWERDEQGRNVELTFLKGEIRRFPPFRSNEKSQGSFNNQNWWAKLPSTIIHRRVFAYVSRSTNDLLFKEEEEEEERKHLDVEQTSAWPSLSFLFVTKLIKIRSDPTSFTRRFLSVISTCLLIIIFHLEKI